MRRIVAVVQWAEQQMRRRPDNGLRGWQILGAHWAVPFQLSEELSAQSTASAYLLTYTGDGDGCTTSDYEIDTSRGTITVGGGPLDSIRLATHASGTRGWCVKMPGRNFREIIQMDCDPTET